MTSQSNETRISLNKISNYILNEQSQDIKAYTSGHLNENHLWKPPSQKSHKPWETALENSKNTSQTLTKLRPKKSKNIPMKSIGKSNTEVEIVRNKSATNQSTGTKLVSIKNLNQNESSISLNENLTNESFKLPKLTGSLEINLPLSDKEVALNMLNSVIFKGATKEEKFKNLTKFEKEVLRKDDLVINNVLHSTDSAVYLEKKLNQDLENLSLNNFSESRMILLRLNIFSNIFEDLINESKIFGDVLSKIKTEYDEYLFFLMRNPLKSEKAVPSMNELNNLIESSKAKRMKNTTQINKLDREIENIENLCRKFTQSNLDLEKKINSETLFYNEKMLEQAENKPINFDKIEERLVKKPSNSEKIESTKNSILQKLDDLNNLTDKLKNDYVPSIVIINLNQTIKDIEIETQKISEQNKFLITQEQEAENELRAFLLKNDSTEFAQDNVELLMKLVKNFDHLQLNQGGSKASLTPTSQRKILPNKSVTELISDYYEESIVYEGSKFENNYDDYFS